MMVRAEYQRPSVTGVLIEPVHSCVLDRAGGIADEKIVQDQPGQGMEGVSPWRVRWRNAEAEAGFAEDPPGAFVSSAAEVEIGPEDDGVVAERVQEVPSLKRATGRAEPSMTGRAAGVEVRAYDAEPPTAHLDLCRYGDTPLKYEG
jgi:hypothetical protein